MESNIMFDLTIIEPIEKIIANLNKGEYRDCDVEWLNGKLRKYADFALTSLDKKIEFTNPISGIMNDQNKARFKEYFTILLNFFKSLK